MNKTSKAAAILDPAAAVLAGPPARLRGRVPTLIPQPQCWRGPHIRLCQPGAEGPVGGWLSGPFVRLSVSLVLIGCLLTTPLAVAQSAWTVPNGTPIAVHPLQEISSATAHSGDIVHFSVLHPIQIGGQMLVAGGADAFGTIVRAEHSKAFGRSGHLELTVDKVQATDGSWIPVHSQASDTGANQTAIVAGAVVFVSVFGALIQGHEAIISPDKEIDIVTNGDHPLMLGGAPPPGNPNQPYQPNPGQPYQPSYGNPNPPPGQGVVQSLAICQSVGGDGNPISPGASFAPGSALVAWYALQPPDANQQLQVVLYQGASVLNRSVAQVMAGQSRGWSSLGSGFAPGAYRVDIVLDGEVQASQSFDIHY